MSGREAEIFCRKLKQSGGLQPPNSFFMLLIRDCGRDSEPKPYIQYKRNERVDTKSYSIMFKTFEFSHLLKCVVFDEINPKYRSKPL